MGVLEDTVDYILSECGAFKVLRLDDDTSAEVQAIEHSIKTRTNNEYKNVGYDISMKKKYRLCIFSREGFRLEARSILKLMTEDGTVIGTSLTPDEIPLYKGKENVIWISEDFIMFTDIIGHGEEAFVLYPFDIPSLSKNVPGCIDPIGSFPTTSTDAYLKEKAGIPLREKVFTIIIAFDE